MGNHKEHKEHKEAAAPLARAMARRMARRVSNHKEHKEHKGLWRPCNAEIGAGWHAGFNHKEHKETQRGGWRRVRAGRGYALLYETAMVREKVPERLSA